VFSVTNKTAASRYARALLDVAVKETADLDRIERELASFVDLLKQYPALEKVLLNPAVPVPRKIAAMTELLERAKLSPILSKLLLLLAGRDRLVLLPDLLQTYRERLMDYQHVVRAEVTTAAPIDGGRMEAIQTGIAALTGRRVTMSTAIDPSIIGGMIARVGSTVYDASVVRHLERMKEMLERT
jgi:F-type H+-transporting ATPase subunit delta